jgi:adenosine deaminase
MDNESTCYLQEIARQLPKSELHLHLDGSLTEDFILRKSRQYNLAVPFDSPASVRQYLHEMKANHRKECLARGKLNNAEKNQNWPHFDFMNQFLQTTEDLSEATEDLCRQLQAQGVWLAEIRFCPTLHTLKGLTEDEIVGAVVEGFARAKQKSRLERELEMEESLAPNNPFSGGIIICALRSYETSHFEAMIALTKRWLDKGVVGFDIAGDEGSYPVEMHLASLQQAIALGMSREERRSE